MREQLNWFKLENKLLLHFDHGRRSYAIKKSNLLSDGYCFITVNEH